MSPPRAGRRVTATAVAVVVALALGSCGGGVSTGTGVSSDEIVLGVMGDQSGPFKNIGQGLVRGNELWAADVNARGGVCGRQIRLEVSDTSYRAEVATRIYAAQRQRVLGYLHVLGSAPNAAVRKDMIDDEVTSLALAWTSFILDNPYQVVPGATYDVEVINGLEYLRQQGLIKNGDIVGHIYIGGGYGDNGLLGSSFYAQAHKLTLLPAKIGAADTDLTNIVATMRRQGAKAIVLTTSPAQAGSAASANRTTGLNVPLLGNNPTFDPALLTGPAAAGLDRLWLVSSAVPYTSDVPKAKDVAQKFTATFPQAQPTSGVPYGYATGMVWEQVLRKACDNKDLTRAGIQAAFLQSTAVTTDDLVAPLDFSKPGTPATRSVYISRPDSAQKGGLRQVGSLFTSPEAKDYKAPFQNG